MKETPNFPYAGTPERYEKWEGPIEVVNILEGLSIEPLQKIEGESLSPKKAVDIDNRALKEKDCPFVVMGRPHAGEFVPQELFDKASEDGKKTFPMIDRGTDYIFRSPRIPSVGTKMSRWIADPNRPPLPGQKTTGSVAPGEVLWKKSVMNTPFYKEGKTPTDEKIRDLSERFYLPYYNGMMATIGSLTDRRERKERVLVLDGHSFMVSQNDFLKPICDHYKIKDLRELPLFIVGDRDGESCDADIQKEFIKILENKFSKLPEETQKSLLSKSASKIISGVNEYMKGVRNVQFYGQRQEGVNSLQLELNEGMFVDEKDGNYFKAKYNKENLEVVRKLIEETCLELDKFLKNDK